MGPWYGHPSFTFTEASWVLATLILSSLLNNNLFFGSLLWPLHCSSLCLILLDDTFPLLLALPFFDQTNRSPRGLLQRWPGCHTPKPHSGWDTFLSGVCNNIFLSFGSPKSCHSPHFTSMSGMSGAEAAWSVPNIALVLVIFCPSLSPSHEPKQKWDCTEDMHVTSLISGY